MALSNDINETRGFWCEGDFSPDMRIVSGRRKLVQRLMVRLQTPRGRFTFRDSTTGKVSGWPNFGTDLAQFLNTKARPSQIASAAESECLKDEQVERCTVTAAVELGGRQIRLTIEVEDAEGPFEFTLEITQAAVSLVELQAA